MPRKLRPREASQVYFYLEVKSRQIPQANSRLISGYCRDIAGVQYSLIMHKAQPSKIVPNFAKYKRMTYLLTSLRSHIF